MADTPPNYRRIFADICNGYTASKWKNETVYIKHFTHFDQTELDLERERYFDIAKARGIPSLVEKLEWLNSNQLWGRQKESEIIKYKSYLDNLEVTKKQLIASTQIKDIERQIKEARDKYLELENEKQSLISYTCETYVDEKIQSYYIYNGFYKDKDLKIKKFEYNEFEDLDDDELNELMGIYLTFVKNFTTDCIKKISVAHFFSSYFCLIEDVTKFFGKPIAFLTFNQANLIFYGQYYKHLLRNHGGNIPKESLEDPNAIEEYINRANNVKDALSRTGGRDGGNGGVAIIGATKSDLKNIKGGAGNSILQKSKELGGISNLRDAIMLS